MSLAPTPTIYFNGIDYNPLFYQKPSGISLTYVSQNYLSRIGPNPTSVATKTSFSGNLEITSTTESIDHTSGCAVFTGGVGIGKNLNISSSGVLRVSNSIEANSRGATGAIIVSGGILSYGNYYNKSNIPSTNSRTGAIFVSDTGGIGCGGNINGNSNLSINGESVFYDGGVNNNFAISGVLAVDSIILGNQITAPKIICNSLKSYGEIDYLNKIGAFLNLTFFPYTIPISSCIDDIQNCYGTLYLERLLTIDCSVTLQPHYKIVFLTNLNYVLSIIDNTEGEKPYYQTLPNPNYYSNYNQCFKIYLYYNNIRIY